MVFTYRVLCNRPAVIPTAVAQGNTLDFLGPLAVLHLLQCIPRCHGVLQRMLSMSPRMRVLYHCLHVQMEIMHHNSQPTITDVSGTYILTGCTMYFLCRLGRR